MKYYKFSFTSDIKIAGNRFPQILGIENPNEYNTEADNSVRKINFWSRITDNLNVPNYILHSHAKRTDLLSGVSNMLLISNNLKELIELYNIPAAQIFETSVLARKKKYNYFLFYLPDNYYRFIDFSNSTFALVPITGRPVVIQHIEIETLDQFEKWIKKYPYTVQSNPYRLKVIVNKLVLNSEIIPYDMFRIMGPLPPSSYFISEKLKNAIIEKGYTGMEFTPLDEIRTVLPPV